MPQKPDFSKAIGTMKKDIDQARKRSPIDQFIPSSAALNQKPGIKIQPAEINGNNPRDFPDAEAKNVNAGAFLKKPKADPFISQKNIQTDQMQKIAEEKQRVEQLRIEEQKRKEEAERIRRQEEEKKRKIEDQKKEEERRNLEEEKRRKDQEEEKKRLEKEREEEKKAKKENLAETFLKEDLSSKKREILEEKRKIDQQKSRIDIQLKQMADSEKPFEAGKSGSVKRIEELKVAHQQLAKKEEEIESEKRKLEEKESSLSGEERKKAENERWRIEEKRRDIEKRRWVVEKNINILESEVQNSALKYWPIKEKEDNLRNQALDLEKKEEGVKAKMKEIEQKEEFKNISETKGMVEKKVSQFGGRSQELDKKLESILNKEKYIEDEERLIEEEEKKATGFNQRKEAEEKRWLMEKQRRDIEKQRWQIEEEKKTLKFDLENASKILENLRAKSEKILSGLEKLYSFSRQDYKISEPKKTEQKKIEPEKTAPMPQKIEKPEEKKEIVLPEPAEKDQKLIEEARKKIEELKKKEIIEKKAGIEIISPIKNFDFKSKEVQAKPEIAPKIEKPQSFNQQPAKTLPPVQIFKQPQIKVSSPTSNILTSHPLPRKAGLGRKIFARVLSVVLVAALLFLNITFWYWYIFVKPKNAPAVVETPAPTVLALECKTDADCDIGKMCSQENRCIEKSVVILPPAFPIPDVKTFKIYDNLDIPAVVMSAVSDWSNEEGFEINKLRRIVIINEKEKREVAIKEIFSVLAISLPEYFSDRMMKDYTFFGYSQKEGVRLGFIFSITDSENFAKEILKREPELKNDFRSVIALIGLESPLAVTKFSSASKVKGYTGIDFRYLPVSKNDLGVCYTIYNNYFVVSTSFESIKKALEELKKQPIASPLPSVLPSFSPNPSPSPIINI